MPITKQQAMSARYGDTFHYTGKHPCTRHIGPRGGVKESITNVRVSGMCKIWKTRPNEFRLPVKYGLYENNAIDHNNTSEWHTPNDCPLEPWHGPQDCAAGYWHAPEVCPCDD